MYIIYTYTLYTYIYQDVVFHFHRLVVLVQYTLTIKLDPAAAVFVLGHICTARTGLYALAMFSVLVAAAVTTMIATIYGYPISATHSIIGGLIATGLAAKGKAAVDIGGVTKTCVAWVASPLLGMLVAGIFYVVITKQVLQAANPGKASEKAQYVFVTLTVAVASSFILMKGPEQVQVRPYGAAVGVALGIGIVCAVLYYFYRKYRRTSAALPVNETAAQQEKVEGELDAATPLDQEQGAPAPAVVEDGDGNAADAGAGTNPDGAVSSEEGQLSVRSQSYTTAMGDDCVAESSTDGPAQSGNPPTQRKANLELIEEVRDQLAEIASPSQVPARFRLPSLGLSPGNSRSETGGQSPVADAYESDNEGDGSVDQNAAQHQATLDVDALARATAEQEAEQPFVPLLILSALSVAFAHGGNDVGNAVGPMGVV